MSWVAGCAWIDVVTTEFSSLGEDPTLPVFLANVGISALLFVVAVVWFVVTGTTTTVAVDANRAQVERYFVTNSFAFFVGWVWLVACRNALALVETVGEDWTHRLEGKPGSSLHLERWYGDFLVTVLWAPGLTVFIFWAQSRAVEKIAEEFQVEYMSRSAAAGRTRLRGMINATKLSLPSSRTGSPSKSESNGGARVMI
eukprot:5137850-Prymnesium_polylepis.1